MQTIKPSSNQLFCKPEEKITKTQSGILLDASRVEKPKTAVVINVGDGVKGFKSNDKIIYKSYSTTDIKLNNEDYFIVAEEDVLGTVLEVQG